MCMCTLLVQLVQCSIIYHKCFIIVDTFKVLITLLFLASIIFFVRFVQFLLYKLVLFHKTKVSEHFIYIAKSVKIYEANNSA